jgi:chromosome segregation ATPase
MAAPEQDEGFVERLSRQGEEALGKVAEELIANPVVNGAIARAFDAREKALQAQEAALGALNLPSAADIERVTRRLRSLSQRLEGIEDAIDRLEERVAVAGSGGADRTAAIQARLDEIAADLSRLREAVSPSEDPVPRAQERLTVTES